MAATRLTPQQERELLARLQSHPTYQQMLQAPAPHGNEALKRQTINNWVFNHPDSPLAGMNAAQRASGDARGSYRVDANGRLQYVDTYGHPTAMKAVGLAGIAAATGGVGLGLLPAVGGGAAGASGAGAGAGAGAGVTTINAAGVPGSAMAAGAGFGAAPAAAAAGGAGAAGAAGAGASSATGVKKFLDNLMSVKGVTGMASLIPLLMNLKGGSGSNPFSSDQEQAMFNEVTRGMELQRKRMEATQPVFDTMVNQAYGASPTGYRGAPPANYKSPGPPQGAYVYRGPTFGGDQ